MEVKNNSKKQILKSFLGWLPIAVGAAIFYWMFFGIFVIWILTKFCGLDEDFARQIGLLISGVMLVAATFAYLNWFTKRLSSYRLAIEGEILYVKGISGWGSVDKEVEISNIQKIFVGGCDNSMEKLSGHGAVRDQVASRLTFFPYVGKSFKLDFATKAFDNESLMEFLEAIKRKGCETNVSV